MSPVASWERRRRAHGAWALALLAVGWWLVAWHAVGTAHVHDDCTGQWRHVTGLETVDACCEGSPAVLGTSGAPEPDEDEPRLTPASTHWHTCVVLELVAPFVADAAPKVLTERASDARAPPRRSAVDVAEREPRYRLAPKGSPPWTASDAVHV